MKQAGQRGRCLTRTRRTTPCVVSSTASRTSCSDDGSELLTRSIRWLTPSTYRTCQVFPLRSAPKVRKIRFECSATPASITVLPGRRRTGRALPVSPTSCLDDYEAKITEGSLAASSPRSDSVANASQKLRCIDWFSYVVICPKVKHENPVCRLTRTQHKKWNIL